MKFVIQNVQSAQVYIKDSDEKNKINEGMLIYMWISQNDIDNGYEEKIDKFVQKLPKLDIFVNENDKIKKSLGQIDGEILVIPNFTLYARNHKWTQIDFSKSGEFSQAKRAYKYFLQKLQNQGLDFQSGGFGSKMEIDSHLNGPINLVFEI